MSKFLLSLKNRFREPSTYVALGAVLLGIPPETAISAVGILGSHSDTAGMLLAGLGMVMGEKGGK